ncbi:YchJ family protein [Stenotrophomonas mori]|uniref:UPF0225 protein K5L01_09475 n=1 Tax=Stenotrophomonas mori TaxID=2871096 RepID=A0ABT0SHT6_9GAMM|nr:YchJ family metal-binding protein [Stenotrophomonas mori]MCL7714873.1 SEC-C domain-containing protein [Stenotrophomonas mori]
MQILPASPCPCGSGSAYEKCCARWHAGAAAPDAEALMRSRYSAYVVGDAAYLRATWHITTRPGTLELEDPAGPRTHWLGLEVKAHRATGEDTAEVRFVARYRVGGGRAVRLQEHSRFVREQGRWYYLDAIG